jgi:hypothetical protein
MGSGASAVGVWAGNCLIDASSSDSDPGPGERGVGGTFAAGGGGGTGRDSTGGGPGGGREPGTGGAIWDTGRSRNMSV